MISRLSESGRRRGHGASSSCSRMVGQACACAMCVQVPAGAPSSICVHICPQALLHLCGHGCIYARRRSFILHFPACCAICGLGVHHVKASPPLCSPLAVPCVYYYRMPGVRVRRPDPAYAWPRMSTASSEISRARRRAEHTRILRPTSAGGFKQSFVLGNFVIPSLRCNSIAGFPTGCGDNHVDSQIKRLLASWLLKLLQGSSCAGEVDGSPRRTSSRAAATRCLLEASCHLSAVLVRRVAGVGEVAVRRSVRFPKAARL
jgi:hypothetical protein